MDEARQHPPPPQRGKPVACDAICHRVPVMKRRMRGRRPHNPTSSTEVTSNPSPHLRSGLFGNHPTLRVSPERK
jgi:hypothetical protein